MNTDFLILKRSRMKYLFYTLVMLSMVFQANGQQIKNNAQCEINVTAICYSTIDYPINCNTTMGHTVNLPPYGGTAPAPGCPDPDDMVVAYEFCWGSPFFCGCTILDLGITTYPNCRPPFGSSMPLWTWTTPPGFVSSMPPCNDCSIHGGNIIINADGDITID